MADMILMRLVEGKRERIITNRLFFAKTIISACRTPCVHGALFAHARRLLRFDTRSVSNEIRDLVVIFDRKPSTSANRGRMLANVTSLQTALQEACSWCRVEIFDHRQHKSLDNLLVYFARTIFAVGVHGGALYNSLLLAPNTTIVEIFPKVLYKSYLAKHITWLMASMFGHTYWRLHTDGGSDAITLNESRVANVLKNIVSDSNSNSKYVRAASSGIEPRGAMSEGTPAHPSQ